MEDKKVSAVTDLAKSSEITFCRLVPSPTTPTSIVCLNPFHFLISAQLTETRTAIQVVIMSITIWTEDVSLPGLRRSILMALETVHFSVPRNILVGFV